MKLHILLIFNELFPLFLRNLKTYTYFTLKNFNTLSPLRIQILERQVIH